MSWRYRLPPSAEAASWSIRLDGINVNFNGDSPTLIVHNLDKPGHVAEVTSMLSHKSVNIATMQLYRNHRGGYAVMVVETDQDIPAEALRWTAASPGRSDQR